MKKETKTTVRRIILAVVAVLVVAALALMPLIAKNQPAADGPKASILSGKVTTKAVEQKLLGGGTLEQQEAQSITVPEAVKLTKLLKKNGDAVAAGDSIATVDKISVMEAISQVQETLTWYSAQIDAAAGSSDSQKVTARAGGTVKAVYAAAGDKVQTVMLEHGALAVLSLDGRMSVTFETQAEVPAAAEVTVVLESGKTVTGTVESSLKGIVKVILKDENYTQGQQVKVQYAEAEVGDGTLEINSPWKVTAYTGTVAAVSVKVGASVDAGDTLMKLSDTGNTATWQQLVDQRTEYEEMMLQLFKMYQTGLLTVEHSGVVTGLDAKGSQMLELLAGAPNGDDSISYINYIGKVAAVGMNGWAVLRNPMPQEIKDYRVLEGVNTDETQMIDVALYDPMMTMAPLYELAEGQWVQAEMTTVQVGDVILFAGDSEGNFVWLVRIKKAETQQPPQPGGTEQPGGSERPSGGNSGSMPNFGGGNFGGGSFGGSTQEEEEFEAYSLATVEVATVIAQEKMTLSIQVDEQDILKLQEGQTAEVAVEALPGQVFTGTITNLGTTGSDNGGSSKFTVELTMERDGEMLAGMHATAMFQLENAEDVPTVPVAALVESGAKTLIYTGYDEKNETLINPVEVQIGLSDGETAQILSGIDNGDTYYYSYYDTLEISAAPDFGGSSFFGR